MTERAAVRAGSPRRRLIAVVALGALALGALAGCRTDAGTAAFVGHTRVTDAQVNAAVAATPAGVVPAADGLQADVVQKLIFVAIAEQYAAAEHIPAPVITADSYPQYVTQAKLTVSNPAKNPYIVATVAYSAWLNQLLTKTTAGTPTEAQLRYSYDAAVKLGLVDPASQPYAQLKSQISTLSDYPQAAALQTSMAGWVKAHDVTVSPRYQPDCAAASCPPLAASLLPLTTPSGQYDALVLPLGAVSSDPAVVDAPSAVSTAPAGVSAP